MLEETVSVTCPYCGQRMNVVVDVSAGSQDFVEDCGVCCRPVEISVTIDPDGDCHVAVGRDDA